MKVIVGLGNPGKRYENTPHNIGSRVVAELAASLSCSLRRSFRVSARLGRAEIGTEKVMLAVPRTWMNESGIAVSAVLRYYKADLADLIVVVDDADLELGRLRLRGSGSSGGHKGLASVSQHVGGEAFTRLRIGIGRDRAADGLVDHVLSPFGEAERKTADEAVGRAVDALVRTVESGLDSAMNEFNKKD